MDKHTFIGKRKIGSTEICDFTDYQGIGHDPLYKRYDSVNGIIKRVINPKYAHFLAAPDYSTEEDTINWYINEWNEVPVRLVELTGQKRDQYENIKNETISHYKDKLNSLSGEELQVMACALRYINDEFIFCSDNNVYLLAWGMTPDTKKHISIGELVHESPNLVRHKITFIAGEHGDLASKLGGHMLLPENTILSANDLPTINAKDGYKHIGWSPEPIGQKVNSDMQFTAIYEEDRIVTPPIPPIEPKEEPEEEPKFAKIRFNAGKNGKLIGNNILQKQIGSSILSNEIPVVEPNNGYMFKGWSINPLNMIVNRDTTIDAIYEQRIPWYKQWWIWLTGSGCLKWLLWLLLAILLITLLSWLLRGCHGCTRDANGVSEIERVVDANGDTIDDNGHTTPIGLDDGHLPDDRAIVAPIRNEDGNIPPIERQPGVPPTIANRLFLFLEDENDNVDALAADFKKTYPDDKYSIIGFDRDVKSLLIQIPEAERDEIRKTINAKIPNHKFIVFDEEIYELNSHLSTTSTATPGWHLNAIKAKEGWQITKGSASVKVAVIDDGIEATHPIFKNRIVDAYNVYTQNNKLSAGEGHGTHTAGLAVGSLDFLNQGAAGIAPQCLLIPVQVIDNKMCPLSALVSGIMYAIHKDADVVNISIGPSFEGLNQLPIELQNEIAQTQFKNVEKLWARVCKLAANKNTILVFAVGNDDILSSIPPENRTSAAITVGAVDQKRYPTDFTNYGPCTDISAPGKEIYSSFPYGNFRSCDGTSMAAPIVTGTVALMKSLKKDLTVTQARNVLYRTGVDVYGNMPPMVQVNLALEAVKKGDFSEPSKRVVKPVPDADAAVNDGPDNTLPSSWSDPSAGVVNDDSGTIIAGTGETATPIPVDATSPANNESDYDAIRRLIAIYKQKIIELEGQLPENKK